MTPKQDSRAGCGLASKPSTAFSTASATSAATSRSGGSKLLFGEIDLSSERSTDSYASVCSFVLCDSSTFLRFWLEDRCRENVLSYLPKRDLASLRLACHDFSVRAAPALFNDLKISFKANTFTKPAKIAALDRLGFYVRNLTFEVRHSRETFLPPLVDPWTGAEFTFTYTPCLEPSTAKRPKYGDIDTTEILTRQWPTLFHAATNVPAFVRAFSNFVNLAHLTIACPGYDPAQRYRRSIVDYALISLRIAIERNSLNALEALTLSPIHPGGLLPLTPLLGYGATPRSRSKWARMKTLTIHADAPPSSIHDEYDYQKLFQTYLNTFRTTITTFNFKWIDTTGPFPLRQLASSTPSSVTSEYPRAHDTPHLGRSKHCTQQHFQKLLHAEFLNIRAPAADIADFVEAHKSTVVELNFDNTKLTSGTWDDALAPLIKLAKKSKSRPVRDRDDGFAEIPIMLSPTAAATKTFPAPMERVEFAAQHDGNGRRSMRMSRWLSTRHKNRPPTSARRVRDGLAEAEAQLMKVLRGSMFAWL